VLSRGRQRPRKERSVSELSAPKKPRPTVAFEATPGSKTFQALCHEMYKRFGGAYNNLLSLCKTTEDKEVLRDQLHELRSEVRELLEKARQT
jgi:hypothetical protein